MPALVSLFSLFFFFCPLFLKVFRGYIGRKRKSNAKNRYRAKKMRESQSNIERKKTQLREKMKSRTLKRENMDFVIPIDIDFHGKF